MNDSIIEDFLLQTNSKQSSLDDSLCSDDLPQPSVPPEEAAVSHKTASSGDKINTAGSCSTNLNDSLFDDDETQLPEEFGGASVTEEPSLTGSLTTEEDTQLPGGDATLPIESAALDSFTKKQGNSKSKEENTITCEKPKNVDINSTLAEPATEKPSASLPKTDNKMAKQNIGTKVRPSFGKKKKFFNPPTSKPVSPDAASSEASVETHLKMTAVTPAKKYPKLQECTNQTEAKNDSIPKTSDTPKQISNSKENEDKENAQPESKSSTAKSAPTSKSKPINTKKTTAQEEREKKHREREKAKSEKEEAKREKERLKAEKKHEQDKKKAEREQKKMERELKKMEKLQVSLSKIKAKENAPKSPETDKKEETLIDNETCEKTANAINAQENVTPLNSTPTEDNHSSESSKSDIQEPSTDTTKQSLIIYESTTENTLSAESKITNNDTQENCAEANQNTPEDHSAKPKKRKQRSNNEVPAPKKFKPAFNVSKPLSSPDKPVKTSSKPKVSKSKPPKQAKDSSRSKPANYSGPVWVQCDDCDKWRALSSVRDPSLVPESWVCSMNEDTEHAMCDAPEEVWSDLGDSQEFVESPFVPGSLVWAKMDSYPWWPAMIEEDPDEETYYEMSRKTNKLSPVKYHVVFLDTPVCRAWVHCQCIRMFTESEDPNQECRVNVPKKYRHSLKMSTKQASKALVLSFKERLERLSFSQRFKKSGKKRKAASLEKDDSLSDKQILKVLKSRKHKSVRLSLEKLTIPTPKPVDMSTEDGDTKSSSLSQQGSNTKQDALLNQDNKSLMYMAEE